MWNMPYWDNRENFKQMRGCLNAAPPFYFLESGFPQHSNEQSVAQPHES
jgi:hypothetical protein